MSHEKREIEELHDLTHSAVFHRPSKAVVKQSCSQASAYEVSTRPQYRKFSRLAIQQRNFAVPETCLPDTYQTHHPPQRASRRG